MNYQQYKAWWIINEYKKVEFDFRDTEDFLVLFNLKPGNETAGKDTLKAEI